MSVRVNYILQQVRYKVNKVDSKDSDNIPDVKILTAYNEARLNWLRRNLVGQNLQKIGDDGSKRRMDDFNAILSKPMPIKIFEKDGYYITEKLFDDYFAFKRLNLKASSSCCKDPMPMIAYLCGEGDVPIFLKSSYKSPNYEWGHTICTLVDGRLYIYTDNKFKIDHEDIQLMYFKFPPTVKKEGVLDLESGDISTTTVNCVFKKDLVNLFIAETAALLSGEVEQFNQNQINQNQVEQNN